MSANQSVTMLSSCAFLSWPSSHQPLPLSRILPTKHCEEEEDDGFSPTNNCVQLGRVSAGAHFFNHPPIYQVRVPLLFSYFIFRCSLNGECVCFTTSFLNSSYPQICHHVSGRIWKTPSEGRREGKRREEETLGGIRGFLFHNCRKSNVVNGWQMVLNIFFGPWKNRRRRKMSGPIRFLSFFLHASVPTTFRWLISVLFHCSSGHYSSSFDNNKCLFGGQADIRGKT